MYRPAAFVEDDLSRLHTLVQAYPLGLLLAPSDEGPGVHPIPWALLPTDDGQGLLQGHVARGNPVWQRLTAGQDVSVVFQGPEGYISPNWYPSKAEHGRHVPTWNYTLAQAWGPWRVRDTPDAAREVVQRLTAHHEASQPRPWQLQDAPPDFIEALLRAIVCVEIPVRRWQGKWKLSQNRSAGDVAGVLAGLEATSAPRAQELARWMQGHSPLKNS